MHFIGLAGFIDPADKFAELLAQLYSFLRTRENRCDINYRGKMLFQHPDFRFGRQHVLAQRPGICVGINFICFEGIEQIDPGGKEIEFRFGKGFLRLIGLDAAGDETDPAVLQLGEGSDLFFIFPGAPGA